MLVSVYWIDTNEAPMERLRLSSFVLESDLRKAESFINQQVANEKIASSYLKNRFIGEYHLEEHGKPVSAKTFFNVSHSKGMVMMGIASRNIGVDIEKIRPIEEDLKAFVSTPEEYRSLKDDSDFFSLWTNKESLLKAFGSGIDRRLPSVPGLPLNGLREFEGKTYRSATKLINGCLATITVEGDEPFDIDIQEVKDYA